MSGRGAFGGRLAGAVTPYRWSRTAGGGWRIGFGPSGFLVAEGSGWSMRIGMDLYRRLERDYWRGKR